MIALVALGGFAITPLTQSNDKLSAEYSDYEDVGKSGNQITGDKSFRKKLKQAVSAPIKKVTTEVKRVETKVGAEAKRVEEKFTGPAQALKQMVNEIKSISCGRAIDCFTLYLLLGNNVKLSLTKTDPKTNKPVADFLIEVKGEGKRVENKIDIIISQKLNSIDANVYLQRFSEREKSMNADKKACFNVFKNGVGATIKKLESKSIDCRFDINKLSTLKSEKDVLNLFSGALRDSLVAEKISLADPVDLLGFIKFRTKQNAPCKGPLLDNIANSFHDLASVAKTSIDSAPCKKIVRDRKKKLVEGLMQQQNILDFLTAG